MAPGIRTPGVWQASLIRFSGMLLRMPGHADGSARRYRERNSTADRALDILLLFTAEKPVWAGTEIATQLGVARSTGYRYLQSLVSTGFIEEAAAGFRLGPRIFELARLARAGIGLSEVSLPSMRRLADVKRKKHKRIEPGQSLPFLLLRIVPASRRDPVKAERSEPQGSLDGVARCERLEWEGMAGWRARQVLGLWDLTTSHPFALFFELPLSSVLVGFLFVSWCCHHLTGLGRKSVWFPLRP